ncbi:MAG: thiamine-phosphate kinase, partial [Planctomycetota bacterium]
MKERRFIEWIRGQTKLDAASVPVGPGDDCAVLAVDGEQVLVTTDQVLDGVHIVLAEHGPHAAGVKAMARGLSDVAAMAGVPIAAVATVALPKGFAQSEAEKIYSGLREVGDAFECPIVGGDVGTWEGALAITVTVFARRADGLAPILRGGAKVGDAICVTGELGGAWGSRRHLEFTPRIAEAIQLAKNYPLRSMIDISDGLASDLGHICTASDVGAEIVVADIPVHADARECGGDDEAALQAALTDGEDYELLFSLGAQQCGALCEAQPLDVRVTCIGRIIDGEG